jgi:hypothetical protein
VSALYDELMAMLDAFPPVPPPEPVRLTHRQIEALPKAEPQPYGLRSAELFGVPVYQVDRIEDSTVYQLKHPGEPASVEQRHDQIAHATARAFLGPSGSRLLEEDALLRLTYKQIRGLLIAAEDAMCALDITPDVRTAVLSRLLLGSGPDTYVAPDLDAAAGRVADRRAAVERMSREALPVRLWTGVVSVR